MDDAADHSAVINSRLAPRVGWKQRLQPKELRLSEPKTIAIHWWSPFGDNESQSCFRRNPLV
jgi:hypothetical protein